MNGRKKCPSLDPLYIVKDGFPKLHYVAIWLRRRRGAAQGGALYNDQASDCAVDHCRYWP